MSGFKEIYKQQVMHRDLKLANILVHLPEYPHDLIGPSTQSKPDKKAMYNDFLKNVDLAVKGRL